MPAYPLPLLCLCYGYVPLQPGAQSTCFLWPQSGLVAVVAVAALTQALWLWAKLLRLLQQLLLGLAGDGAGANLCFMP